MSFLTNYNRFLAPAKKLTRVLGLSNDLDDLTSGPCPHGIPRRDCLEKDCRRVLSLAGSLEIAQHYLPRDLLAVFPDEITVIAAQMHLALKDRESQILQELVDTAGQISLAEVGRCIGWSKQTVQRDCRKMIRRFLVGEKGRPREKAGTLRVTRRKGQRGKEYWVTHVAEFGKWRTVWYESVLDKKEIRRLQRKQRSKTKVGDSFQESPMRRLWADLNLAFASSDSGLSSEPLSQREEDPDWSHNLKWAKHRIQGKRKEWDNPSYEEVSRRIRGDFPKCRYCRTPILLGCRIKGKRITRRREFCDDACKMRWKRRQDS